MQIDQYRTGRNFIRVGDTVRVKLNRGGFKARVLSITADEDGTVVAVDVMGATRGRAPAFRSFRPERIQRLAQTKDGQPR